MYRLLLRSLPLRLLNRASYSSSSVFLLLPHSLASFSLYFWVDCVWVGVDGCSGWFGSSYHYQSALVLVILGNISRLGVSLVRTIV